MRKKAAVILCLILVSAVNGLAAQQDGSIIKNDVVIISLEQQYEAVKPGGKSALAIHFEPKQGWHFYASAKTAPGGMNLQIKPSAETKDIITFSEPVFPSYHLYFDKTLNERIEVFSGEFTVYLPLQVGEPCTTGVVTNIGVKIGIEGAVCSNVQCRVPDFGKLITNIKISPEAKMDDTRFVLPEATAAVPSGSSERQWVNYPIWFALGLAFLAGLSLNIMPCVWPVLPLIVMRIVEQAKKSKGKSIAMGLAFCLGILLFFMCLAIANIVLRVSFDTTLQWGDPFRNSVFKIVMALVLIVLALFMFDVFSFVLPASISGKTGGGFAGTTGMGFLAAVLSTPCSFGILAAAFAWAQAQPLLQATVAIMVIGVGMVVPYAILTSIPGLLESLPRPGKWMDICKKAVGFILLTVAVWMIAIVPQEKQTGVMIYSVVLAFCVWMWGGWVDFNSKTRNKIIVRTAAFLLALGAGYWLLSSKPELIDWQDYDAQLIEKSLAENKPVLIDFTADWCMSCIAVEKLVYERKDVAELIKQKGVVAIKADTSGQNAPATKALKDIYNEPGVPVSILFVPGRKEPVRWRGKTFSSELKHLLEELPEKN